MIEISSAFQSVMLPRNGCKAFRAGVAGGGNVAHLFQLSDGSRCQPLDVVFVS